jgi:ATP-binding cassette subfamily C (CFTR/MRP) protein 4
VDQIERVNRYRAFNEAIFYLCNVATSVVIFLIHVGSGGLLTPRNVFTTMVLINVAQMGELWQAVFLLVALLWFDLT